MGIANIITGIVLITIGTFAVVYTFNNLLISVNNFLGMLIQYGMFFLSLGLVFIGIVVLFHSFRSVEL